MRALQSAQPGSPGLARSGGGVQHRARPHVRLAHTSALSPQVSSEDEYSEDGEDADGSRDTVRAQPH